MLGLAGLKIFSERPTMCFYKPSSLVTPIILEAWIPKYVGHLRFHLGLRWESDLVLSLAQAFFQQIFSYIALQSSILWGISLFQWPAIVAKDPGRIHQRYIRAYPLKLWLMRMVCLAELYQTSIAWVFQERIPAPFPTLPKHVPKPLPCLTRFRFVAYSGPNVLYPSNFSNRSSPFTEKIGNDSNKPDLSIQSSQRGRFEPVLVLYAALITYPSHVVPSFLYPRRFPHRSNAERSFYGNVEMFEGSGTKLFITSKSSHVIFEIV